MSNIMAFDKIRWSIIILHHGALQALAAWLKGACTLPATEIVVVGPSTSPIPQALSAISARIKVFYCDLATAPVQLNKAISLSRGQWISVFDDRCIPAPGCLHAHRGAMEKGRDVIVGSQYRELRSEPSPLLHLLKSTEVEHIFDEIQDPKNLSGDFFYPQNCAFGRHLFDQLGGFDESLPVLYGADFGRRAYHEGATLRFLADAACRAVERPTLSQMMPRWTSFAGDVLRMWDRYPDSQLQIQGVISLTKVLQDRRVLELHEALHRRDLVMRQQVRPDRAEIARLLPVYSGFATTFVADCILREADEIKRLLRVNAPQYSHVERRETSNVDAAVIAH